MAKKRKKADSSNGDMADNIKAAVRGFVIVLLVGVVIFAVMDFLEKGRFQSTFDAIGEKLRPKDVPVEELERMELEGVPIEELPGLIQGSPRITGNVETDSTVVYRWGFIRAYDMTLSIQGSPERAVVRVE